MLKGRKNFHSSKKTHEVVKLKEYTFQVLFQKLYRTFFPFELLVENRKQEE